MMTKLEFLEKYGEVELSFTSYYKFSFTFAGEAEDGALITASYGGSSDDVYRYAVGTGVFSTVEEMEFNWMIARQHGVTIYEEDNTW
jgi:hypothetical protein